MSEQANKALVLANRLSAFSRDCCNDMHSAAAELRRLHEVNAELLKALQRLVAQAGWVRLSGQPPTDAELAAHAAIRRALGQ